MKHAPILASLPRCLPCLSWSVLAEAYPPFLDRVAPSFTGKDACRIASLLREFYRAGSDHTWERLIALAREAFPDFTLHADANSSYDVPNAPRIGRWMEKHRYAHFEEPAPFDLFHADTPRMLFLVFLELTEVEAKEKNELHAQPGDRDWPLEFEDASIQLPVPCK